jgi:hypothetical protein
VNYIPEAMLPLSLHDPGVVLVHKPNGEGEVPEERKRVPSKTSNRTLALPTVLKEKEINHGLPNLGTFQSTVGTVPGTSNVPVPYLAK